MNTIRNRQQYSEEDGSTKYPSFETVRDAIFANPYHSGDWESGQEYPDYRVTLGSLLSGFFSRGNPFKSASHRTIASQVDLRWGNDLRGQRRLLHPNGVCLVGKWTINSSEELDQVPAEHRRYTGMFAPGSAGRVIGRYSTCCTQTQRNRYRSLSLVGKIYAEADQPQILPPAAFITQEDLGGSRQKYINDVVCQNAPDTTFWRRGLAIPVLLLTGITFMFVDREIAHRQLYEIAEFGKPTDVATNSPRFMRLRIAEDQYRNETEADFRNEVMSHFYSDENQSRQLSFVIEVSNNGWTFGPSIWQRRFIKDWTQIGKLTFHEATVSYNSDFVIHFHHPAWRNDRNNPNTVARKQSVG